MSDRSEKLLPSLPEQRADIFRPEALDSHANYNSRVNSLKLEYKGFFALSWIVFLVTLVSLIVLTMFQKLPVTVPATAYPISSNLNCSIAKELNVILLITKKKLEIEPGSEVSLIKTGSPTIHGALFAPDTQRTECLNKNQLSPSFLARNNKISFIETEADITEDSAYSCYIETGQVYIYQRIIDSLNGK